MRAVTTSETRRPAPRDIRRQKRGTSPTSIIMCVTFEEGNISSRVYTSTIRRVLFHGSYPLNKEPLRRAEPEGAGSPRYFFHFIAFIERSPPLDVIFSRKWFSSERSRFLFLPSLPFFSLSLSHSLVLFLFS